MFFIRARWAREKVIIEPAGDNPHDEKGEDGI
jgi:hypothetical protein